MTPLEHIEELRKRIIRLLLFIIFFFIAGAVFSNIFIQRLQKDFLFGQAKLVVLSPLEFLVVQLKIGFEFAVILATPLAAYELFMFIKPAFNKKIVRSLNILLWLFVLLYFAGLAFAYFVFLPLTFYYITPFAPSSGISNMWGLDSFIYLLFISIYSTALIFEIPLMMLALVKTNVLKKEWFSGKRRFIYVAIFVIAAIVTPGVDVVTQTLVAVPMLLLYEVGNLLMFFF